MGGIRSMDSVMFRSVVSLLVDRSSSVALFLIACRVRKPALDFVFKFQAQQVDRV